MPVEKLQLKAREEESLELLLPRFAEIKAWQKDINAAKDNKAKAAELRKKFKAIFGVPFGQKLVAELNRLEKGEVKETKENKNEKREDSVEPLAAVAAGVKKLQADVSAQQSLETAAAQTVSNPELNQQALSIDKQKKAIVVDAVDRAEAAALKVSEGAEKAEKVDNKAGDSNVDEVDEESLLQEILSTKDAVLAEIDAGYKAELEANNFEEVNNLELEKKIGRAVSFEYPQEDPAKKNEEETNGPDGKNLENRGDANENKSESHESETPVVVEALEYFHSLGLNNEDLLSIPGLTELNGVSQILIAKSLKNSALEKANRNVAQRQVESSASAKGFFGKIGAGIANSFKIGRQKKEAILAQAHGGLAEYKVELTRLVYWAKNFSLKEIEIEKGKFTIDFTGNLHLQNINEEQAALVKEMNENANWLASFAKEFRLLNVREPKGSKEHQEYYHALRAYEKSKSDLRKMLESDLKFSNLDSLLAINNIDANVNIVQFMSANPDLEKEWKEMVKNPSILRKMLTQDNLKFMAGGFAGRSVLAGVFGAVAIPAVAAAVGAWRGMHKAHKRLRTADKGLDKKDLIGDSPLLLERKEVLQRINKLVPAEYSVDVNTWLSNIASPEDKTLYYSLKQEFDVLDARWQKENKRNEKNKIERKVLSAESLMAKLELLLNEVQGATGEKREEILFRISRRVEFMKDLANKGLVNFGSADERGLRLLDFYQLMSFGEAIQSHKGESGAANDELKKMNERAGDLLNSLEYAADKKLDKQRRLFIKKKMLEGALVGAVFSKAGSAIFHHLHISFFGEQASASSHVPSENLPGTHSSADVNVGADMHQVEAPSAAANSGIQEPALDGSNDAVENFNATMPSGGMADDTAISSWSDQISNEGLETGQYDSVWLSTKNIFESHASELGYQGDVNDAAALNHWAEIQTNRTLADTGDINDRVFAGNQVILEKNGDGFTVRVEAGSGAQPGYLSDTDLDSLSPDNNLQEAPLDSGNGSPVNTPDAFIDANKVPNISEAREIWADEAGNRFGLSGEQVSYVEGSVIKAEIKGHDVFIDTDSNTYLFFDDNGNEVSGFLADDDGHIINNAEAFLDNKFCSGEETAAGVLDHLSGNGAEQEAHPMPDQPDASVGQNQGDGGTPPDIRSNFDNIVSNHARGAAGGSIKEALETIASRAKTPADKVLLEYIEENHISPEASLRDLLSNDAGLSLSMRFPENSVFTQLYDLRHASSGQAQADMLYKYLHAALSKDLNDPGKLARFDKLAALNVVRVGSSPEGKVDKFVMQVNDNVRKVDFSVEGLSEVLKFVKEML